MPCQRRIRATRTHRPKTIKDQAEIIHSLKQENIQLDSKIQELFSENQKLSEQLKQLTATVLDLQKK